ncbi:MAG: hypothetical protein AB7I19_14540 [Planctomycetota bacterium]
MTLAKNASSIFALASAFTWFGLFSCRSVTEEEGKAVAIRCNVGPIEMRTSLCDYPVVRCGFPFRTAYGHNDLQWSRERGIPLVFTNTPSNSVFSHEQGLWQTLGNFAALIAALSAVVALLPNGARRFLPRLAALSLLAATPAALWWIHQNGSAYA